MNIITSFDLSIPFFGLNSTEVSFEINSNLILKSGNDLMLRSIKEIKFNALELKKTNVYLKINNIYIEIFHQIYLNSILKIEYDV